MVREELISNNLRRMSLKKVDSKNLDRIMRKKMIKLGVKSRMMVKITHTTNSIVISNKCYSKGGKENSVRSPYSLESFGFSLRFISFIG